MDAADIISTYGAGLATVLAAQQILVWLRNRPRIKVSAQITYHLLGKDELASCVGTPMIVQSGDDFQFEEAVVTMNIANSGSLPLQISAVLLENPGADANTIAITQIVPTPLPHTLDPRTSIEVEFQKEWIDMTEGVSFIGVVDALGRRHGLSPDEARELLEESWRLPTRVAEYSRRDDPSKTAYAFQQRDPGTTSTHKVETGRRRPTLLVTRPWPPDQVTVKTGDKNISIPAVPVQPRGGVKKGSRQKTLEAKWLSNAKSGDRQPPE